MHNTRTYPVSRRKFMGTLEKVRVTLPNDYGGSHPFPRENPAPVPNGLDWNLWLGPAPYHPYTPNRADSRHWRKIFDYSGGPLTDWGAHLVDTAQLGAGMDAAGPVTIQGTGDIPRDAESNVPMTFEIQCTFPNGVVMHVNSGAANIRFEGTAGWVGCKGWNDALEASSPDILQKKYEKNAPGYMPLPPGEHRNFIDGIQSGKPTTYFPEAGQRLFTTLHLGHLAIRAAQQLKWDPARETLLTQVTDPGILDRPARNWEQA
jgi:predicted dehydrogenase